MTRSGATGNLISLNYATANGTASAGSDYTSGSNSISFAAGETSKTITVNVLDDSIAESSETFTVSLSNVTGASVADGTGTGTITDNDTPTVSVSSPSITEGSQIEFTVSLSNTSASTVSFTPILSNGTATIGTDTSASSSLQVSTDGGSSWSLVSGAVTIAAGQTSVKLRIASTDDAIAELSETFTLQTGSVTGTVTNATGASGTATITDNDYLTPLTVTSPTVNEASPYAVFTVSGAIGQTITLALGAGTATAGGTDFGSGSTSHPQYSLDGGTTWATYDPANKPVLTSASMLVRTPVTEDGVRDNGETFTLTATSTGGTPVTGTATINDEGGGTIFNPNGTTNGSAVPSDDRPITITSPVVNEATPYAVFTIEGTSGQAVSLALAPLTATGSGTDYGSSGADTLQVSTDNGGSWSNYSAAVTLPGSGKMLARVPVIDDSISDNLERFTVTATPRGGTAVVGTATINDQGGGQIFTPQGFADNTAQRTNDNDTTKFAPVTVMPEVVVQTTTSSTTTTATAVSMLAPADHVLAAVADARTSTEQRLDANAQEQAGAITTALNTMLASMDPALHVLPAVAEIRPDLQAVVRQVQSIAGNQFSAGTILGSFNASSDIGIPERPMLSPERALLATPSRPLQGFGISVPGQTPLPGAAPLVDDERSTASNEGNTNRPTGDQAAAEEPPPQLSVRNDALIRQAAFRAFQDQVRQSAERQGTRALASKLKEMINRKIA